MKISLMTINFMDRLKDRTITLDEVYRLAKDSGYEAVDVCVWDYNYETKEDIRRSLDKYGLKVSSFICFSRLPALDEREYRAAIQYNLDMLDDAEYFGAKVFMVIPMLEEEDLRGRTEKEALDHSLDGLKKIVPVANSRGMDVVIEDSNFLNMPMTTMEELDYILDYVPGLKLVYDSANMILVDEDPVEYYEHFKGRIGHIHLKDMRYAYESDHGDLNVRGEKMTAAIHGTGMVDFPELLKKIKTSGYDRYLTVELPDITRERNDAMIMTVLREYVEKLLA